MRKIAKGYHGPLSIFTMDEKGPGGAYHKYEIHNDKNVPDIMVRNCICKVDMQKGPVKEAGVNGCQNEDLIAIIIDRLECFQSGGFSCYENGEALFKLHEALHWMNHRTADRERRNVEGYNKK